jgi:hypothetical protein
MRAAMAIGLVMSMAWPRGAAAERHDVAAPITLRIHDYAGVPARSLTRAQRLVTRVYERVGVRTRWARTIERRVGAGNTGTAAPIEDVTVIVLNRQMSGDKLSSGRGALGFAAITAEPPGRIAYVVYDRVDMAAADSEWTLADLLSVVIAHEIAHLYLPPGSHSAHGLMRGEWTIADLRRTDPRRLRFSARQGELLRSGLCEPPATAASDTRVVGELQLARAGRRAGRAADQALKRRQSMPYRRTR